MTTTPRVLVVEDNPVILTLAAEVLICAGCDVVTAETAEAAMVALGVGAEDLHALVTDVDLGTETTGFDVARHARRLNPNVTVIYASGSDAEDFASERVPGSHHLPKPYCPVALCRLVASVTAITVTCDENAVAA